MTAFFAAGLATDFAGDLTGAFETAAGDFKTGFFSDLLAAAAFLVAALAASFEAIFASSANLILRSRTEATASSRSSFASAAVLRSLT